MRTSSSDAAPAPPAPLVVLASRSPQRSAILEQLGVPFRVAPSRHDETLVPGDAVATVVANARGKAAEVAGREAADITPGQLVLGVDTVVVLDGKLFGKPRNCEDAQDMLGQLVGRRHEVITGVCLVHRPLDTELTFTDTTRVWMWPLMPAQIAEYLGKINPLDKAGAYAIQEHGGGIVERIEGSYSNVMVLPIERLRATLERLGVL